MNGKERVFIEKVSKTNDKNTNLPKNKSRKTLSFVLAIGTHFFIYKRIKYDDSYVS